MTCVGSVKNFNPHKGFGFITAPDGSDVFLHIKAMADDTVPQQGDTVSYDVGESPVKPGQTQASNVTGGTGTPIDTDAPGTGTLQGSVKSWNTEKGFGFLIGGDGVDIFLHIKACVDGKTPQAGDVLTFDAEPGPNDPEKLRATNVTGGTGGKGGGKGDKGGKGMDAWGGYGKGMDSWGGGGKMGPYGKGDKGKGKGKMSMWGGDGWGGDSWGGDSWSMGSKGGAWGGFGASKGFAGFGASKGWGKGW